MVQGHPRDPTPLDFPMVFVKVDFCCYAIFMCVTETEAMYERSSVNIKVSSKVQL